MPLLTKGTELYFVNTDSSGCEVVKVACATTISGLTASRDQIETTCLDSEARTYEPGLPNPGAMSFGINYDPAEASHVRLHELYRAGTKFDFAIGLSDGTALPTVDSGCDLVLPSTRTWITFNGYISDFPFDISLNTVVNNSVSVQVSDFPVVIPKT